MADISITQAHTLSLAEAREAAQVVADKLATEFSLSSHWDQDVLRFQRAGVSGMLVLRATEAQLDLDLGMMLKGFASMIEEKLLRKMKTAFAG